MRVASVAWPVTLAASVLAASVPQQQRKVDYTGYQSLRISVPEGAREIEEQIEAIAERVLDPGHRGHIDAVVAPDKVAALMSFAPDTEVLIEDVGAAIAEEGDLVSTYAGETASPRTAPRACIPSSQKRACARRNYD